jgi:hypothetical protein
MKINDVHTYRIKIQGQVEKEDASRTSPLQFRLEQAPDRNTSIMLQTDQSGLIGLLRHLHGLGLVILSVHSSLESKGSS